MKKIMSKLNSRITPKAWNWLKCFAAATAAIIGGIEALILVFAWPNFTTRHQEIMLAWGWIGWIPGGLIGVFVTIVLGRLFIKVLLTSTATTADRRYALASLLGIIVVAVFMLNHGNVNIKWQEQVRMADGNTLLLKRTAKGESQGIEGWKQREMSLELVELPMNWPGPPVWHTEFVPILLDYQPEGHIWNAIAKFYSCGDWEKLGHPKLPYVQYQSRNGGLWKIVPLEERLIGRNTNLLIRPRSSGEPRLVTVEQSEKRNRSVADESRRIVAKWHNSCSPFGRKSNG